MECIGCSKDAILYDHPHVKNALATIEHLHFPEDDKDYFERPRASVWFVMAESILLACRLNLLVPNQFQCFLCGHYIQDYKPTCCCACGLTPGSWCGEYFNFNLI